MPDKYITAAPYSSFARLRDARDYLHSSVVIAAGGKWEITTYGRGHHVVQQTKTAEQMKSEERRRAAEFYLSERADWLSPSGMMSVYRERDQAKAALDKFQEGFAKDAVYALKWATDTFETAARYNILCRIIQAHEDGWDAKRICAYFEGTAKRQQEHLSMSQSSSACSNLMEHAERLAIAKYAECLRRYVDTKEQARGELYEF